MRSGTALSVLNTFRDNIYASSQAVPTALIFKRPPLMKHKFILVKAVVVTVIAIISTFALSFSSRLILGMPIDWLSWIECTVIPIAIAMPISSYIFLQAEKYKVACEAITELHATLKETHEKLAYSTTHDQATGLLNRDGFIGRLARARMSRECDTLLLIDVNDFAQINYKYGHVIGDEILNRVARALLYCTRSNDVVGRTGGAEFGVLLKELQKDGATVRAEIIRRHIELFAPIKGGRSTIKVTVNIGGSEICEDVDPADLLRHTTRCLWESKQQGQNRISFTNNGTIE